ncbi:deoxyribodipyrimidine photo-lyase [Flavobacteriaceae bacterium R38]|nr:deoxyribodipyrimidine photo-lyase [Flavobacteriaceae bacterium R38]
MSEKEYIIFWFRRDLRLLDNVGLSKALAQGKSVLPIFIFDNNILHKLPKDDPRVNFIYNTLQNLRQELNNKYKASVALFHGNPLDIYKDLIKSYKITAVYTNHDYEPYAIKRDKEIYDFLREKNILFKTFKDQVIFERNEIVKADGNPYVVYTPYMRKWKETYRRLSLNSIPKVDNIGNFISDIDLPNVSLHDLGFINATIKAPEYDDSPKIIQEYEVTRNYPAIKGTSLLSLHLRFGTVSPRLIIKKAVKEENETFWNELIWREFFMQILWHFPHTVTKSFKEKYDRIVWRNNEEDFKKWCEGKTGYPLVDAGMRQLNKTGFMHNRVRMLVGSFLCKHLLIDWRWGEAYFAEKLLDYEMASNVGNWQWVAGCGVDAAPYFRIFNPTTQITKFDKDLKYINQWVTDLNELTYPLPIVEHKAARERCLNAYKEALN